MRGALDFPRFMTAVGMRNLNEKCFDGWITVDRWNGDMTFCRLPLEKAIPFVWTGWLLPTYKSDGQLSHLSWCGPASAEHRLGLDFSRGASVRGLRSGLRVQGKYVPAHSTSRSK